MLVCAGLRKTYGARVAVDDVSFHIDVGETYGLLGPNGAGKTTTISMACGLLTRDGGEITVAGRPIGPRSTGAKAAIGLVPQEVAHYDDLTAEENLHVAAGDRAARHAGGRPPHPPRLGDGRQKTRTGVSECA
jgi:ABC-2 type transport system ATP-binding protein